MKKSVNFNGFQAKHRRITAEGLIDIFWALGMSDEEIIAEMKKLQAAKKSAQQAVAADPNSPANGDELARTQSE